MPRSRSPMTSSSYRRERTYSSYNNHTDNQEENGENGCRIHVADLASNCTKHDIEKAFEKWPIIEVWHAQASCFAFVVMRHREDGQKAISEFDGRYIGDARVRVSLARPRTRGGKGGRTNFDPNMRCYQCGSRGHFSRDCDNDQRGYKKNGNGYRSCSRDHHRERSYSRSRSRSPRSRVIRDYRRYSPRRIPPTSNSKFLDKDYGYYTSPPRK